MYTMTLTDILIWHHNINRLFNVTYSLQKVNWPKDSRDNHVEQINARVSEALKLVTSMSSSFPHLVLNFCLIVDTSHILIILRIKIWKYLIDEQIIFFIGSVNINNITSYTFLHSTLRNNTFIEDCDSGSRK